VGLNTHDSLYKSPTLCGLFLFFPIWDRGVTPAAIFSHLIKKKKKRYPWRAELFRKRIVNPDRNLPIVPLFTQAWGSVDMNKRVVKCGVMHTCQTLFIKVIPSGDHKVYVHFLPNNPHLQKYAFIYKINYIINNIK
jgi:hypothetical protein